MADTAGAERIGADGVRWSAGVTSATTGDPGRRIRCTITGPGKAGETAEFPATAAALSAAAHVVSEPGVSAHRGRRDSEQAPWAILGRLDAVGCDGLYRLRVQVRKRPMKTFRVTIDGQEYDVTVEEVAPAAVPHGVVRSPKAAKTGGPAAAAAPGGERAIRSPMPGKVLAVNVAAADAVDTDTVLLVLEAMKMENDILAPAEGTVKSVHVRPGESVNTGDVMMVIE
jgi:glutaconyl-CoA/methylmalonyl-CoA decarboxylase subunit gamma